MPKKYKINKKGAWAKQKSLDVTTAQKVNEKKIKLFFFSVSTQKMKLKARRSWRKPRAVAEREKGGSNSEESGAPPNVSITSRRTEKEVCI